MFPNKQPIPSHIIPSNHTVPMEEAIVPLTIELISATEINALISASISRHSTELLAVGCSDSQVENALTLLVKPTTDWLFAECTNNEIQPIFSAGGLRVKSVGLLPTSQTNQQSSSLSYAAVLASNRPPVVSGYGKQFNSSQSINNSSQRSNTVPSNQITTKSVPSTNPVTPAEEGYRLHRLLGIEETIWCPCLGIKGQLDMVATVKRLKKKPSLSSVGLGIAPSNSTNGDHRSVGNPAMNRAVTVGQFPLSQSQLSTVNHSQYTQGHNPHTVPPTPGFNQQTGYAHGPPSKVGMNKNFGLGSRSQTIHGGAGSQTGFGPGVEIKGFGSGPPLMSSQRSGYGEDIKIGKPQSVNGMGGYGPQNTQGRSQGTYAGNQQGKPNSNHSQVVAYNQHWGSDAKVVVGNSQRVGQSQQYTQNTQNTQNMVLVQTSNMVYSQRNAVSGYPQPLVKIKNNWENNKENLGGANNTMMCVVNQSGLIGADTSIDKVKSTILVTDTKIGQPSRMVSNLIDKRVPTSSNDGDNNDDGNNNDSEDDDEYEYVVPVELKTGAWRASTGLSHRAQVIIN